MSHSGWSRVGSRAALRTARARLYWRGETSLQVPPTMDEWGESGLCRGPGALGAYQCPARSEASGSESSWRLRMKPPRVFLEMCTTWALLVTKSFSHRQYSAGSISSPTSLQGSFGHRARVIELPLCGIRKPTSPPVNELVQISNGQRGEWPCYLPLCHAVPNCFG